MMNLFLAAMNFLNLPFGAIPNPCNLPGAGSYQFFGFPHWWEYLNGTKDLTTDKCVPYFNFPNDILAVGLAVVDILLRAAGIVAVIAIIIAGIEFITSAGSADKAKAARTRIQNALIGLVIVVIASLVVSFIGNNIGG